MSLVGKYHCAALNANFVVTSADNSQGRAVGQFELGGITIPVNIHYHFRNNVGPITDLWFSGNLDNPDFYTGGAGRCSNAGFPLIELAGAYPTNVSVEAFKGIFARV